MKYQSSRKNSMAVSGGMETIIKTKGEIGGPLEQFGTVSLAAA